MLGIVLGGEVTVDHPQLGGDDLEGASLEPGEDFADQSTFDGVGLADDESAVHGVAR